jgi:hypothetical protein
MRSNELCRDHAFDFIFGSDPAECGEGRRVLTASRFRIVCWAKGAHGLWLAKRLFQLSDCDPPNRFSLPCRSSGSLATTSWASCRRLVASLLMATSSRVKKPGRGGERLGQPPSEGISRRDRGSIFECAVYEGERSRGGGGRCGARRKSRFASKSPIRPHSRKPLLHLDCATTAGPTTDTASRRLGRTGVWTLAALVLDRGLARLTILHSAARFAAREQLEG